MHTCRSVHSVSSLLYTEGSFCECSPAFIYQCFSFNEIQKKAFSPAVFNMSVGHSHMNHSSQRLRAAVFHLSTWILFVYECVCLFLRLCACTPPSFTTSCSPSFSSSLCYLTSSGPPTNPLSREKIERFIGTPVRTPPGFMASRQRLSLRKRQSKKWWEEEEGRRKENKLKNPATQSPICI